MLLLLNSVLHFEYTRYWRSRNSDNDLQVNQAIALSPWSLFALPGATPPAQPWRCISSTKAAKPPSGCVNRGLSPQLILLLRPAAARHRRIELGWARCIPAIGAARKAEGCPVSLLCLVKAASVHPYPPIKLGCRSEQPGAPGAASGGVMQGQRETSRR